MDYRPGLSAPITGRIGHYSTSIIRDCFEDALAVYSRVIFILSGKHSSSLKSIAFGASIHQLTGDGYLS